MDREMMEGHLALAERHVAEGEARIRRQRELVDEIASTDHGDIAAKAVSMLEQVEEMQVRFVADRDRLSMELARL